MPEVTYDGRSMIVGGERMLLLSGAIHYPRSTPGMWPELVRRSREAGLNCIETYVFWNLHEKRKRVYDFSERFDLPRFLRVCADEGMYVILRIGPYICAETNFGGFPPWLLDVPGLVTRTWNEPFMKELEEWMSVLMAKVGRFQLSSGGPIILAQMENEYGNVARRYGEEGQNYLRWSAECGRKAGIDVPLIMCEGGAEGVIETMNGFSVWERIGDMRGARPEQPPLWTENWPGWYDVWGRPHRLRSAQDVAYEVLRFFGAGGAGVNYYMWHGGTNFGREAMYLQTTSYDYDAPLDEYGLPTLKLHHLSRMHGALRQSAELLLEGELFHSRRVAGDDEDGMCLYGRSLGQKKLWILANGPGAERSADVLGEARSLPPRSAEIVIEEGGRVSSLFKSWVLPEERIRRSMAPSRVRLRWEMLEEPVPLEGERALDAPDSMLPSTRDETDYGWYCVRVKARQAKKATLEIERAADVISAFVNGRYVASLPERLSEKKTPESMRVSFDLRLKKGENVLSLLVAAVGLIKGDWMIDAPQSEEKKGIWGRVLLDGKPPKGRWTFRAGLWGESSRLYEPGVAAALKWGRPKRTGAPLRWYRAGFSLKERDLRDASPWALKIGELFKGLIWLNGICVGRYWQLRSEPEEDSWKRPHVTVEGAGKPPQQHYHIPRSFLGAENTLVIFEERGALPEGVRLVRRK